MLSRIDPGEGWAQLVEVECRAESVLAKGRVEFTKVEPSCLDRRSSWVSPSLMLSRVGLSRMLSRVYLSWLSSWVDPDWSQDKLSQIKSRANSTWTWGWSWVWLKIEIKCFSQTRKNLNLRYFNYFIQTNYLWNEENLVTSNSNNMYFNLLKLLKSIIQS